MNDSDTLSYFIQMMVFTDQNHPGEAILTFDQVSSPALSTLYSLAKRSLTSFRVKSGEYGGRNTRITPVLLHSS